MHSRGNEVVGYLSSMNLPPTDASLLGLCPAEVERPRLEGASANVPGTTASGSRALTGTDNWSRNKPKQSYAENQLVRRPRILNVLSIGLAPAAP